MDPYFEKAEVLYDREDYIDTTTGNKVSRKSVLCGSQNIHLSGKSIIKPGVMIRGDLARVSIGRYCVIEDQCVLRPPYKIFKGGFAFFPQSFGDHVFVGAGSIVEAASIGCSVQIGRNCIISKRVVIHDCCYIEDNAVIPPDAVIPPFSRVGGVPASLVEELPESTPDLFTEQSIRYYDHFRPRPKGA